MHPKDRPWQRQLSKVQEAEATVADRLVIRLVHGSSTSTMLLKVCGILCLHWAVCIGQLHMPQISQTVYIHSIFIIYQGHPEFRSILILMFHVVAVFFSRKIYMYIYIYNAGQWQWTPQFTAQQICQKK